MAANGNPSSYVVSLDSEQAEYLKTILQDKGWHLDQIPHSQWRARKEKTTVVAYTSGKLVVQGKGTSDFVQFILEPEILKEARFGYEDVHLRRENPEMFTPHIGVDESGKGDYFGPLVVAALYVDENTALRLAREGVTDSKMVKSDKRVLEFVDHIKDIIGDNFDVVTVGPDSYNRMHRKMGNVNTLLAWGHARALENLLAKAPDCPRAVSDQFAAKSTLRTALLDRGRNIELIQVPRAEADIAVAAASLIARGTFVEQLQKLGKNIGLTLPKGAGPPVDKAAAQILSDYGEQYLEKVAKLHFRTTEKIKKQF